MSWRLQSGFTLIELMIVVAIIAILAAIALPAYQDYVVRAQVSEGVSLTGGAKLGIMEVYGHNGHFPADNSEAGVSAASAINGKYVESVTVGAGDGLVTVRFSTSAHSELSGRELVLSPVTHVGAMEWNCKTVDINSRYLPSSCR